MADTISGSSEGSPQLSFFVILFVFPLLFLLVWLVLKRLSAERALEAGEALKGAILDSSLDAIITSDAQGKIIEWNRAAEEIFGYSRAQALGREMADLIIPPEFREKHRTGMKRMRDTGEGPILGKRMHLPALRADGTRFPSELVITKVQSKPLTFTGFLRDLSEQKKVEDAVVRNEQSLKESESRFRNMADSAPVLMWMTDRENKGVYFNSRWLEFTGRSHEEEEGSGWLASVHPDDRKSLEFLDHDQMQQRHFSAQFRMHRFDGEYRYMLDTAVPRFTVDGTFEGYIGTCSDITELKNYEDERSKLLAHERQLRSQAELASRMKDEFLATLSHELRTPLNSILGWSQLIRVRKTDAKHLDQGLDIIERNARSQARIIEDLLDMNRIISGRLRLDMHVTDLRKVIDDTIETIRPTAEAKEIEVKTKIDSSVRCVRGDPQRLQQIFWNLLSNAVKFTPKAGKVSIALRQVESHVEVEVSDSGQGIKADFLPHVFDRFRQADASTTRRHGGLGLGLSIVKSLVEMHGGSVAVRSEGAGSGSIFTVKLPISAIDTTEMTPTNKSVPAPADVLLDSVELRGLQVLVVDDEPDARNLIRHVLIESGAKVETAGSAKEALLSMGEIIPDVLVSDIGMPEIDGYELLKKIRDLPSDRGGRVPAIALTAFARAEDRLMSLKAGYQMHVAKPVEPAELTRVIANVVARP